MNNAADRKRSIITEFQKKGFTSNNSAGNLSALVQAPLDSNAKGEYFIFIFIFIFIFFIFFIFFLNFFTLFSFQFFSLVISTFF